jgi:hypothetical protein
LPSSRPAAQLQQVAMSNFLNLPLLVNMLP